MTSSFAHQIRIARLQKLPTSFFYPAAIRIPAFDTKPAQEAKAGVKQVFRICGEHVCERKNCTLVSCHREMRCTFCRSNGNSWKLKEKPAERSWTDPTGSLRVSADLQTA
jgi:hypothetical protein